MQNFDASDTAFPLLTSRPFKNIYILSIVRARIENWKYDNYAANIHIDILKIIFSIDLFMWKAKVSNIFINWSGFLSVSWKLIYFPLRFH